MHNKYIYPVTEIKTLNVAQGLIEIESNSNDTNSLHLLNVYCVRPLTTLKALGRGLLVLKDSVHGS